MAATVDDVTRLAAAEGLGVALEAAWGHGLEVGHIPVTLADEPPVLRTTAEAGCGYEFVHIPVRRLRTDRAQLAELGIINPRPDPSDLVFHEDGVITEDTIRDRDGLTRETARTILEDRAARGELARMDVTSRQLRFTDPDTPRRLAGQTVYVCPRLACNYCSAEALFPRQLTIATSGVRFLDGRHSRDLRTARDYRFGFTFAPFDDPTRACHFLAWDDPPVGRPPASMAPHAHSFSDLVRLVRTLNRDLEGRDRPGGRSRGPLAGACNHWAGNSILHQHYQFFRLPEVPLALACDRLLRTGPAPLCEPRGVEVHRVPHWPAPAYLTRTTREDGLDAFCDVVDAVARAWEMAAAGAWATQNTWAWSRGSELRAILLPRDRRRLDAAGPGGLTKRNAGVLEMMGWFILDDKADYLRVAELAAADRRALGDAWLAAVSPPADSVAAFERTLRHAGQRTR